MGRYVKIAQQIEFDKEAFLGKALAWGASKMFNTGKSLANWGSKTNNMFSNAAKNIGTSMKNTGWNVGKFTRNSMMNGGNSAVAKNAVSNLGSHLWQNKGKYGTGIATGYMMGSSFNEHDKNISNGVIGGFPS